MGGGATAPPPFLEPWLDLLTPIERSQARYREMGDRFVAVVPFMFTSAIIVGHKDDDMGYEDRWCFETFALACAAFDAWDGVTGEPDGWHRHPTSGRRRPHGDAANEYVSP